jgi:hypothetical protein
VRRRRVPSAVALALALVVAVAAPACGGDDGGDETGSDTGDTGPARTGGEPIGPADEGIEGVEAFQIDSRSHTEEELVYDTAPPVGGDHFPVPATCGFYADNPPPDSLLVHALEHGAIWVAYDPALDAAQLETLRALVAEEAKVTATPYPGLDSPLVVSAWARQLRLDDTADPRLQQFIDEYRNGPEAPEPRALCQGLGEPEVVSPAG